MKMRDKSKIVFICQECGHESPKWMGKCPDCGRWNTFVEERERPSPRSRIVFSSKVFPLDEIKSQNCPRIPVGIREIDRILGDGIVPGSLILLGGPPGIGKSTLLLQMADRLASGGHPVLYVSGEESLEQIKSRAERLKICAKNIFILCETDLNEIMEHAKKITARFLIVDSIQTVYKPELPSAPGSVGQVREGTSDLLALAKSTNLGIFIAGHITKEGAIAGPKVLEHIVDTVLYFESEGHHTYRILRSYKNRFGPTSEIGVFEMKSDGLKEVDNPSELFLQERNVISPGSVVVATIEGTKPILLELQALVCSTKFSVPRRMATGLDYNRIILLTAILEKRLNITLGNQDIFVNLVGGIKSREPALDLGIVCAIASGFYNFIPVDETVLIGEVGLLGEVRGVSRISERIREAKKLRFKRCIIPENNLNEIKGMGGMEFIGISKISEALDCLKRG